MTVASRPGYTNEQYMIMTAPAPLVPSLVGNVSDGNAYMAVGPVTTPQLPRSNGDIRAVNIPVAGRLSSVYAEPQIISKET